MRKLINDPAQFVDEMVDGILLAHPESLRAVDPERRAIVRADAGSGGRVGIVTGGGSGHLPLFAGYVGAGLASGVAVGNVFSSPSPAQILAATVASDDGAGVLYLYGNYGGDILGFDLAAEMAAGQGIATTTVLGRDDVTSAPKDAKDRRRGVAGLFFAYKCAGASAERGDDLAEVTRIAQKACDQTGTMGVGLAPTILPTTGKPSFSLPEGEMEIGIGIHGEPGHLRGPIEPADMVADRFLGELLPDLELVAGDRVAIIVNGLGATPLEELYVLYRHVHRQLTQLGVSVERRYIGEFATSLEMAGASVSIMRVDDELCELLNAPAGSPFFSQPGVDGHGIRPEATGSPSRTSLISAAPAAPAATAEILRSDQPGPAREIALRVAAAMPQYADQLRDLDAALGDGDLGVTVEAGARAAHAALADLPADAHPSEVFRVAGEAFAGANPSTFAGLFGGGLIAAGQAVRDSSTLDRTALREAVAATMASISRRGGAEVGNKTMVDVLAVIVQVLDQNPPEMARALPLAVEAEVEQGRMRPSQRGRAAWVGERSIGHADPGSVALLRIVEEACRPHQ